MQLDRGLANRSAAFLAFVGVVALLVCIISTLSGTDPATWLNNVNQKNPPQNENASQSQTSKDAASICESKSSFPASDTLEIRAVCPAHANSQVRLGDKISVIFAGVAPETPKLLKQRVDEKTILRDKAQSEYDAAPEAGKADAQKKLASANEELAKAKEALDHGGAPVELKIFLNGKLSPSTISAKADAETHTFPITLGPSADATSDDAKFWRNLIARNTSKGAMDLKLGLSKSQAGFPDVVAPNTVSLRLYFPTDLWFGGISIVAIFLAFAIFATNSTVLRDNSLTAIEDLNEKLANAKTADQTVLANQTLTAEAQQRVNDMTGKPAADRPVGSFSLGRTQMALWLGLVTAGFIFIWLTLGVFNNLITGSIVVLLGINSVTGLAGVVLDNDPTKSAPKQRSANFLRDITSDGEGNAQLQRIQVMIWTCILAAIFVYHVVVDFAFVEFDTYLLLLIGIANSTYVSFKPQEKPAPQRTQVKP